MTSVVKDLNISELEAGAGTGSWQNTQGDILESVSPIDGSVIGRVRCAGRDDYEQVVATATAAFQIWRKVPAPRRGEIVRQIGNALRDSKKALGALVTLEMGKIRAEGEGEVQEMIDIADFAVGQSRMLYGLSLHSERPDHRMYEQWHPLGPVGVITAFNFPVAVWAWNAMLCLIAGDTVIWKPSSKTPLTAIATLKIAWAVLRANDVPEGVLNLVIGSRGDVGEPMLGDNRIPLISATGSVPMGRHVAQTVAGRLGRSLLELGGNNGIIVTPQADMDMAIRAILFGAVGTAGQRCTTTRRIIVHESVRDQLTEGLIRAYGQVRIGNPLDAATLMGPLIDRGAGAEMQAALDRLKAQGGKVLYGGEVLSGGLFDAGTYVTPCICSATAHMEVVRQETFAPILYIIPYKQLNEAIKFHNAVPQGLSSAIFTGNMRESEAFLSAAGSDCGIANVNIGTSGAEIGGAFGGEKETGGGRESGSDAWKSYMRRQTCTINWSDDLPLAQGIKFDI
ncbi:aldehyde dehydrogenase family protein [Desulfonema ishimotonii]|uniref:Aldehyde dehydrogenase family protein n=2 Tax=Desulfonema ishimotonii TaxID=45657 RepID=A0A401G1Y9_9BACT|nr:aldehyde dehydrogenase family protein [Desulfonema ishimotonii]